MGGDEAARWPRRAARRRAAPRGRRRGGGPARRRRARDPGAEPERLEPARQLDALELAGHRAPTGRRPRGGARWCRRRGGAAARARRRSRPGAGSGGRSRRGRRCPCRPTSQACGSPPAGVVARATGSERAGRPRRGHEFASVAAARAFVELGGERAAPPPRELTAEGARRRAPRGPRTRARRHR